MQPNYYLVLGISPDANLPQIRRAYRRLCHECHPDRDPAGAERFIQLKAAYDTLSNPAERAEYDRQIRVGERQQPAGVGGRPPIDIFRDFESYTPSLEEMMDHFERSVTHRQEPKTRQRRDIHLELPLGAAEAMHGSALSLVMPVVEPCRSCAGTGRTAAGGCEACEGRGSSRVQARVDVIIPPHTPDGSVIPVSLTHLGIHDLILQVHVRIPGGWVQ